MAAGMIFNIQKFSLHDGPGIRTVVFFKGCPLCCGWCSNPESQHSGISILYDKEKCVACGACMSNCPHNAIVIDSFDMNKARCTGCGACVRICPTGALTSSGEQKSVSDVVKICLQDIDFYEESNGGVTLSGGEALAQPEFAMALFFELRAHNIHTAIETTAYASAEVFQAVTAHAEELLIDMKHWDETRHIAGTGVPLSPILQNICHAVASGKSILLRIPVIPGFNDAPADAEAFAERIKALGLTKAQLLPFHQFGEKKYTLINHPYPYRDVPALREQDLTAYRQRFIDHGVKAFF